MISNEDTVEMTIGKGGQYEAHLDVDDETRFVIKDIVDVRFFDSVRQEWVDIGYKGPITLEYEG